MNFLTQIRAICRKIGPKSIFPINSLIPHQICCRLIHQTSNNNFYWNLKIFRGLPKKGPALEAYYKSYDQISGKFEMIYRAPMHNYVAVAKHFSQFSLVGIAGAIMWTAMTNTVFSPEYDLKGIVALGEDFWMFVGCALIINFVILYVCHLYPLRIYKFKNRYIAVFEGNLPRTTKKYPFNRGDFSEMRKSLLPWHESMYKMQNKSVLILAHYFKTPSDLHLMFIKSNKTK